MRLWQIAIVEDHALQRTRTQEVIDREPDLRVVFTAETAPEFLTWVRTASPEQRPQLLVLDLMVDRQPSVEVGLVAALLRAGLRIVVLSALASPPLVRSIVQAGVTGIVGKRDREEDLLAAIRSVIRGEPWMSPELAMVIAGDPSRPKLSIQEERALTLYASSLTLEQVAEAMNIGRETAKQYLSRVRAKYAPLGVPVRTQLDLGRIAWVDGYVDPTLPPVGQPTDTE